MEEKKQAVLYLRYSSSNQSEQSIEGQRRVCSEFAERNGYEIIKEYADRALTGKTDNRPDFLKMISEAKNGVFKYIIVYKLDRFSRNKYDSVIYKHKLKEYGVKVVSATEQISDSIEGKVMESLLEAINEMYSDELSQKVRRGINETLLKKQFCGGYVPFGYNVEDKRLVINDEQAEAVRYIFTEYAHGTPQKNIVEQLNARGIKTQSGGTFRKSSVNKIITNRKYIGEFVRKDGTTIENYCEPIIERCVFEQAQKRLETNKRTAGARTAKINYLLSGKVYCGLCGAMMDGVSGTSQNGATHYYYVCANRCRDKSCKKSYENKNQLESEVIKATLRHVLSDKTVNAIATALERAQGEDERQGQIKALNAALNGLQSKINVKYKIFCETESATVRKMLETDIQTLSDNQEEIKQKITRLRLAKRTEKTKAEIIEYFNDFINNKAHSGEYARKIINEFVERVYVFDDLLVIYYNVFDKSGVTYERTKENAGEYRENESVRALKTAPHQKKQRSNPQYIIESNVFGIIVARC